MDVSASWLLSGKGEPYLSSGPSGRSSAPDFISIQRFDVAASAGHGALAETEDGTGHYAFNRKWLERRGFDPENLAVISVRGDSMEPELYDQDLILLDRTQISPRDGDIYVVQYSNALFVKRVQYFPGERIVLKSANKRYEHIIIDREDAGADMGVSIIGKVVASMHEW